MLVLSRRSDESIQFPNLGITIHVLSLSSRRARIGIEAPSEFAVVRGEISQRDRKSIMSRKSSGPSTKAYLSLREHLHDAAEILSKLHQAVEECDWPEAEPMVFSLFRQLRAMDEQVACLANGAAPPVRPAKKRALLVDDNENETKLLASYLRLKNLDVETASDGDQAIRKLSQQSLPDVIVLDMKMPRFDGPWTIGQLRSRPRYKEVPIFAVSGMEPEDYDVQIGPQGVNRWLRKPLNPQQLVDEICGEVEIATATV